MKNDAPPRYLKDFLNFLFLSKNVLFMFGFKNTFIYMTRYVMYHKQLWNNLKVS